MNVLWPESLGVQTVQIPHEDGLVADPFHVSNPLPVRRDLQVADAEVDRDGELAERLLRRGSIEQGEPGRQYEQRSHSG